MDQHYDHCEDKQNKEYVDSLYKVLPNQEALLPNPGQENKSHKAWRSTLMPNSFFFKTFENLFYLPPFMGSSTKGVNTNTDATTSCQQEIYGNGTTSNATNMLRLIHIPSGTKIVLSVNFAKSRDRFLIFFF